jgi:hypothetical protein
MPHRSTVGSIALSVGHLFYGVAAAAGRAPARLWNVAAKVRSDPFDSADMRVADGELLQVRCGQASPELCDCSPAQG